MAKIEGCITETFEAESDQHHVTVAPDGRVVITRTKADGTGSRETALEIDFATLDKIATFAAKARRVMTEAAAEMTA